MNHCCQFNISFSDGINQRHVDFSQCTGGCRSDPWSLGMTYCGRGDGAFLYPGKPPTLELRRGEDGRLPLLSAAVSPQQWA